MDAHKKIRCTVATPGVEVVTVRADGERFTYRTDPDQVERRRHPD